MKIRTAIGLAGASAASLVGMAGLVASPAGAAPATSMPAGQLTGYLQTNGFLQTPFGELPGVPIFGGQNGSFSSGGFPNIKVSGNCPTWVFSDIFVVNFLSGNA